MDQWQNTKISIPSRLMYTLNTIPAQILVLQKLTTGSIIHMEIKGQTNSLTEFEGKKQSWRINITSF